MSSLKQRIEDTVRYIQCKCDKKPLIGIVLGSGLGNLAIEITVEQELSYQDIPHFPVSTVKGHSGKLIFGLLGNVPVLAMSGRFHYYEGYSPAEVSYPIRVMNGLGIKTLLLSNAAGAVNPDYKVGDLVLINDHISFFTHNPLLGPNEEELGPRFPDMSEPYSKNIIAIARRIADAYEFKVHEGVYTGVTGPTFETRAEYKLIKAVGGDVVGMSTVQEVIVAVHGGMQVFCVSVVTDLGIREEDNIITHEEVLEAAEAAEPKLTVLFKELASELQRNIKLT
ncbi:purine-nucleoside phosphorylase [Arachidicoccus rhizosphaerae]|uniref:Purine nucleoside phosphorylase n=1 Tax=Arachidicoccus rhizosphaerae TaxID=551991 RepID=A0A1H4BUN3_9BACT|nr:purine-nucleoside phosphorylase [Arachidicoccus rhizosphaerae]SEA51804.1 purine-nucleoside phosphorylase [Arachidicoccus rhizosphaerae]